ncbi:terminase small subunit [Cytobacillus spongiae]|uniref:terminase small subunit n=1 Tax=Cytobacillus spongiae TaxID=2901381 RepID=UPI001F44DA58|nr:terminase small subunit [Cytobacillus spongiae]UII56242.1 terminase small subunit [Cytobacillus spongiae]
MGNEKLTQKQLGFIEAYLREPNATRAAIVAGYSPNNYHAASISGYRMLKNAKIRAEIEKQQALILQDIRAFFIRDAQHARETLLRIMNDPEAPYKDKRQAACEILDRAMGKSIASTNVKLEAEIESVNFNVGANLDEYEELFNELSEGVELNG